MRHTIENDTARTAHHPDDLDLILWYIPILNRLPRDHKFMLGNRIIERLYGLLDELILARYAREKLARLESLNGELDVPQRIAEPDLLPTSSMERHSISNAAAQGLYVISGLGGAL